MEKYKIYCTEEQTRKAFELGVLIETLPHSFSLPKETLDKCKFVDITNAYLKIPTAEQLIERLESKKEIHEIEIATVDDEYGQGWYYCVFDKDICNVRFDRDFSSQKEATLAAIDAALEYLTNKK
ncbi:MAG: hypothetical protein KBT34_02745 [Prevotella sp.]|nr:hypothetical protein [Candidatus Prevotella equi]